jgi:hypothetical protein
MAVYLYWFALIYHLLKLLFTNTYYSRTYSFLRAVAVEFCRNCLGGTY